MKAITYKLQKRTNVTVDGTDVHIELACGHSYDMQTYVGENVEQTATIMRQDVGKRERCTVCAK